jgi:predicted AlkP superfamily pyrophosphatase or phosphodiesterase
MKNKFQLNNIFAILLVLFSSNIVLSQEFKSEYTIIVVIDGPRYTETFGDSSCKYIPNMGKNLVKEGVLYTNFRNNGPTFTISGHTAMTTGVYQSISNAGKKLPDNPSIFQ